MNSENNQAVANSQEVKEDAFAMPKKLPNKKAEEKPPVEEIKQFDLDTANDLTTEIEEYSKLNIYKASRNYTHRQFQDKTKDLKFLEFQNIEKCVTNSSSSASSLNERMHKYFILGVVVEK